ncbi:hypothetical protein PAPYR_175 [Paratrimastix pyriformis]|uniref:Uncharacterized protein n=1 Tax=Paratrimastix pyriformis TaxID=342808 RepID=A0ABQ8UWV8_9EUKA|nr:hypothetical protein PAPYR_175 [Paratrimastix pyriformis]
MSIVCLRIENRTNVPLLAFGSISMQRGHVVAFSTVQPNTVDIAIHTEENNKGEGCAGVASFEAGQGTGNMIQLSFATTPQTGDVSFAIAGDLGRLFKVTAPAAPVGHAGTAAYGTFVVEQFTAQETAALLQASAPVPQLLRPGQTFPATGAQPDGSQSGLYAPQPGSPPGEKMGEPEMMLEGTSGIQR